MKSKYRSFSSWRRDASLPGGIQTRKQLNFSKQIRGVNGNRFADKTKGIYQVQIGNDIDKAPTTCLVFNRFNKRTQISNPALV